MQNRLQRSTAVDNFFRSRLRLSQLRMLVAVAELGQLKKVAGALNISPPAVSKQIAEIEDALHQPVVTRVGNHIEFTALGHLLTMRARELLSHIDRTREEVNDLCSGVVGSVGIGVVRSVASLFVPDMVRALKSEAPSVAMRIHEHRFEQLAPMLKSGVIDFVVARETAHPLSDEFMTVQVMSDPLVIVCGTGHKPKSKGKLAWSDLKGIPWIMPMPDAQPLLTHLKALLQRNGLFVPPDSLESDSIITFVDLLQLYPFVTAVPTSYAQAYTRAGLLTVLPLSTQGMLGTINAVWRKENSNPIVKLLADTVIRRGQTC